MLGLTEPTEGALHLRRAYGSESEALAARRAGQLRNYLKRDLFGEVVTANDSLWVEGSAESKEEIMRRKLKREPLDVIWTVPDELWLVIEPILLEDAPPKPIGRSRVNWRNALDGILFRMRSGCQWNKLPKDFGDDSSIHRWFQRWNRNGVMEQIWGMLVEHCTALGGVDWKWQSADGAMGKARFGGEKVGPNPTDRAKPGTKRSVLTDARGGPLGVVIDGANRHDAKLLKSTIESIVVERPDPETHEQHLCLDKGYDNPSGREAACEAG